MYSILINTLDKIASSLEEKGLLKEAEQLDIVANSLEENQEEEKSYQSGIKEGSYITLSEPIIDYDNMYKQAGKNKSKRIKKWIPDLKKGALHKDLGVPEDKDIPMPLINKKYKELQEKAEGDKKLSARESRLFKRLQFARNARGFKN